jgi:MFS family permease
VNRPKTALRALLVCQSALVAGMALSFPFLTLYLHVRRGVPMGLTGLAISAGLAATAVGQAIGGELSDVLGCKHVMIVSLLGRAAFAALLSAAVARDWPVSAVVFFLVAAGFTGTLYGPAVRAWIAHEHPAADRARAYGLLRVATNAAWAVGPAIGGFMAGYSYALMFAVTAAMCLVCLVLLVFLVPEAPAVRLGERFSIPGTLAVARDPRFFELSALSVLIACVMAQLVAPLSAHAVAHGGLDEAGVGLLFTVNGALVVLFQTTASALVSRTALTRAAAAGCLFYLAGWSWIGFARGWWPLALGMAIVTTGEIVVSPCLEALSANMAPARLRGRYLGFQGLAQTLGQALGPLLGGLGSEHLTGRSVPAPWLAAGALAGAASLGFRALGRRITVAEEGLISQEAA